MVIADILFYVFAGLALACGFLTVANPVSRSPVASALFLVLTMVWLSGLFVLLHAFFIAAVDRRFSSRSTASTGAVNLPFVRFSICNWRRGGMPLLRHFDSVDLVISNSPMNLREPPKCLTT